MTPDHRPPDDQVWRKGPIFLTSDRLLARYVARPMVEFLQVEAAGGVLLLLAAVTALIWANSSWSDSYLSLWNTNITFSVGSAELSESLQGWVNDGLMVIFFFVVGLEIKYEIVAGHLRDLRVASVPIIAAFGGMAVPALVFVLFAGRSEGAHGWGIPMATDIAFAVGILSLLGSRIPPAARIFLLTLAVVDDIGAITVIAVFYTADVSLGWLLAAVIALIGIVVLARVRVWRLPIYVTLGLFTWFATYQSGVHATIAGVVIGLLAPAHPLLRERVARKYARSALADDNLSHEEIRRLGFLLRESLPVVTRLEHHLHPVSSFVILPIFALANAGVDLRGGVVGDALHSPVTLGIAMGLLIGKVVGITAASWLVIKFGLGRLPERTTWPMMVGLGIVGGIGFTVSLFIVGLSFPQDPLLIAQAKVGVLAASALAGCAGLAFLAVATRSRPHDSKSPIAPPVGSS